METFKGPLGSHRNYIVHVALANGVDYINLKKLHEENRRSATPHKYKEFRFFLNAVESLNNVADYLYFEYEDNISHASVTKFRHALHAKYSELGALADLANAYKHCVRATEGKKNKKMKKDRAVPWARDLQAPQLSVRIALGGIPPHVDVDHEFPWPLKGHETIFQRAFDFWLTYHNAPSTNELIAP